MKKVLLLVLGLFSIGLLGQNQKVRFMTYNLMYFRASSRPCTPTQTPSQRTAEFINVFDFVKPEILLVNELGSTPTNGDFILSNVLNINGTTKYSKADFSNNSFSSIVNMLFFDTTVVGLASQDRVEDDLNNNSLVRVLDIYTLYYKDPKLALGADTTYLTIAGMHLKAGSSTADQFERKDAADALMAYLSTNFSSQNIIVAGDMNFYRNTEPAYQTFTAFADTSVRLYDPINRPGSWNNNSNFADIHTQSTHANSSGCHVGGGCDDRFDFILTSNAVLQGNKGLTYVNNSYKTVGQDGLHFNQSINAGTNSSAPSAIITSLYNLSDHLPVYADFNFKKSSIGLTETATQKFSINFNNPVNNTINLSVKGLVRGSAKVDVIDLSGKTVYSTQLSTEVSNKSIDCSSWYNGLYLLRVADADGNVLTKKIIKH